MMIEVNNYSDLVGIIKKQMNTLGPPIIVAIDGGTGAGKSRLADDLWGVLGGGIIHGDNYKTANQRAEHVALPELLKKELQCLIGIHSFVVIVEGVLLWQTLDKVNIKPNIMIYTKKMSGNNGVIWCDKDELENFEISPNTSPFRKQIIEYHKKENPIQRASIIYSHFWDGS